MNMQFTPFVFIYFVAALVSLAIAATAYRRRAVPGARALSALMVAAALWTFADGLESALVQLQAKVVVSKISHIGIQAIPVLFLIFVLAHTRRSQWLTPLRISALWVAPLLTVLLVFSNELHQLIWANIRPVSLPTGIELEFTYGPLFWVAATYDYALILTGTVLLLRRQVRERDLYRRQTAVLFVATAIPWVANVVYLSGRNPLPGLDWTSLAFVLTGALLAYAIFALHLLDIVPVAHTALIERMSDALLVTNAENRIVDANPAARRLLTPRGELIGKPVEAVVTDKAVTQLIGAEREVHGTIYLQNHVLHGLDALCTPLLDDKGRISGRMLVLRDMSERLRMEEELRRSEQHYRSFLAMMSHELRTPLTGILGMAEAMQTEVYGPLTERQARSLRMIEDSGRHLAGVISNMLDLSRMQSGLLELQYDICTAGDLCRASMAVVSEEAQRKGQRIVVNVESPDVLVRVDPQRLQQVLINLLNNAVKFTQEEGEIGIAATRTPDGEHVAFRVWDNGIGIEPAMVKELFEPFTQGDERLSRAYGGAGLGLALAHCLVHLHGGTIQVESTLGRGSSFTVLLPYDEQVS
jgi:signal transduction histidine kinase